jgi:perosamine synthetase
MCAVSSCTTALHLALLAVGVGVGDEVITASHSFIATANSIRYCGAVPIFVDIDPRTYNIDPQRGAEAVTPHTRAVLAIHQMGMPCDLAALLAVIKRHGIVLIEDAACAAGSEIRVNGEWEPIGQPRGNVACFSFHPRKVITTGEWRDADDLQPGFRLRVQATSSTRDEHPGYGTARLYSRTISRSATIIA